MKKMSFEKFYNKLQESKEGREYCEMVQKIQSENRLPRKWKDGFEVHHIHPRALGGDLKASNNLIKVSCFEHCRLHVLLARAIQCYETLRPIAQMSGKQYNSCEDLEKITLEEIYKWSKLREEAYRLGIKHSKETRRKMSELAKGKNTWSRGLVWVNNGQVCKRVRADILEKYLKEGWAKGELSQSEEVRKEKSKRAIGQNTWSKGRVRIHKEEEIRVVPKEELEKYYQEGWQRGWPKTVKSKVSNSSLGKKGTIAGRTKIHKGDTVKLVHKEDLESFLQDGWLLGDSEQRVAKRTERLAGRLWINDGSQERQLLKGNSLPEGWSFGRLSHK